MEIPRRLFNRTFAELTIGESVSHRQALSQRDADLLAVLTGDSHALSGWIGILLSSLIETRLPGPGTSPLSLELHLLEKILPGVMVEASVTVAEKRSRTR